MSLNKALREMRWSGIYRQRHLLPWNLLRAKKKTQPVAKDSNSSVEVRISRDFNNSPNAWFWGIEVTKGSKVFVMKGCAPTRFDAETMADDFVCQILNPTEACA